MYQVKPGRGPSAMGAVVGILMAVAGLGMLAMISGSPFPGPVRSFGILFVLVWIAAVIIGVAYNARNAFGRKRLSSLDVVTDREEPDPLNERFGVKPPRDDGRISIPDTPPDDVNEDKGQPRKIPGEFCPYCGERVRDVYDFCPKCGKDI